jgi:hypothetical protein
MFNELEFSHDQQPADFLISRGWSPEETFHIIPFSRKNPYYQRSDHLDIKSFPNVPLVGQAFQFHLV